MIVVAYHWLNGAYINSYDDVMFARGYAELTAQFGPPAIAIAELRD